MTDKTDPIALITDITHFVGGPASKALSTAGFKIFGVDPSFTDAGARQGFAANHPQVTPLAEQDPAEIVKAVVAAAGRLDVLINNDAFPALRAPVDEANESDLHATFQALTFKPFAMSSAVTPLFKQQGKGKIIFLTSAAPLNGLANYSMYAAARGATNALMLSLARELAPHNIQVNAIAPNYVDNPDYFPKSLMENPKAREKILKNIPLGRLGRPEEAGATIAFLASSGADFITGQIIPLAGGWASAR